MLNQEQIRHLQYDTLAEIKNITTAREGIICFCSETETFYEYHSSAGSYIANDKDILITGNSGNTRWLGTSGKYIYDTINITGGINLTGTESGIVSIQGANDTETWTLTLPLSAGTNGYVLQTDGSGNTTWIDKGSSSSGIVSIKYISNNYTILDNDGYELFLVDISAKDVILTLPLHANNIGRKIEAIIDVGGGSLVIQGNGSEFFNEYNSLALRNVGNRIELIGGTTKWNIKGLKCNMQSGGINTNSWLDRNLGTIELIYDNKTGTFLSGEIVAEYSDSERTIPTGKQGRIIKVDGVTKLLLKDIEGDGTFTNNYYLKGLSSLTIADVNGNTKNINTNFYHGWGTNLNKIKIDIYVSTLPTFSWTNSQTLPDYFAILDYINYKPVQIDTNNIQIHADNDIGNNSYNIVAELLL